MQQCARDDPQRQVGKFLDRMAKCIDDPERPLLLSQFMQRILDEELPSNGTYTHSVQAFRHETAELWEEIAVYEEFISECACGSHGSHAQEWSKRAMAFLYNHRWEFPVAE